MAKRKEAIVTQAEGKLPDAPNTDETVRVNARIVMGEYSFDVLVTRCPINMRRGAEVIAERIVKAMHDFPLVAGISKELAKSQAAYAKVASNIDAIKQQAVAQARITSDDAPVSFGSEREDSQFPNNM